jgi:NosR/NirI family transcriptional regulator, nitrous oxide reductase regulator
MRPLVSALVLALGALVIVQGQSAPDAKTQSQLKRLFPKASAFSAKGGEPPHYKALLDGTGGAQTVGYAFWTTEVEPNERGYDGPIRMLVGMDIRGILTGIIVVEHHEPYGYFSIGTSEFAAQFRGKDIRKAFRVDAVSQATISVTSATRAIRNSAIRIARAFLVPPGNKQ